MASYTLVEKDSFTVLGFGIDLKSDYTDYMGINKEKSDFFQKVHEDGTIDTLKAVADNDYIFIVNEAVNDKMMHYAGVMTKDTLPDATRVIQFPKGEYLIVSGEEDTSEALHETLTGIAFGQALPEAQGEVSYVGGPNASVEMEARDGKVYGEMWVPVVRN